MNIYGSTFIHVLFIVSKISLEGRVQVWWHMPLIPTAETDGSLLVQVQHGLLSNFNSSKEFIEAIS